MVCVDNISASKETLKLLSNIRIILSSKKNQVLQEQFKNYLVKNLCRTTEFDFLYFTTSLKNMKNMHPSIANQ